MTPMPAGRGTKPSSETAPGRDARKRLAFGPCLDWLRGPLSRLVLPAWLLALALAAGHADSDPSQGALSGGAATVQATTRQAFGQPLPHLTADQETRFFVGNSFFNRNWVSAPASTTARDGLGPLFNARSCSACHLHDGRGRPPAPGEDMLSMLVRLSVPGDDSRRGVVPEPVYGDQFNGFAVPGVPPEGKVLVTYEEMPGAYEDGERYSLRRPIYAFSDLQYGPMHPDTLLSPRVAPAMVGLGLLEAVPESALLALADPRDADGDGISGRPNRVWDKAQQRTVVGRFGWKANQPSVAQQVGGAFLGDIGITSSLFPDENCTPAAVACRQASNGGNPELPERLFAHVVFYSRTLAVPARRNTQLPQVRRGRKLFDDAQCNACHTPTLETGAVPGLPDLSGQVIHPYTDLLLHDMGDGLADNRPDFEASGFEWRTPPLWGIGLLERVNRHTLLLHDGRARNLAEAILWHGGEAEDSKEYFRRMPRNDREALLQFLNSL
ncbi:MAG: c-type cytochrome [Candidatus Tectomicrobia bacterium]|nr:c-type cytochrome [Candidatus Tectomicrobia bacterium]